MGDRESLTPASSSLIGRVTEMAVARRPEDPTFATFVGAYFADLPDFDLDDRREEDLYASALAHYTLGHRLAVGSTTVSVRSPDPDRDGWNSDRSMVFVVTDDRPFLVDTTRMVLEAHGVNTHLLIHPMLSVVRDATGVLVDAAGLDSEPDSRSDVEAWTQIEIDRQSTAEAAVLTAALLEAIELVRRTVDAFDEMRSRMLDLVELDPLLGWFADGQLVFLGAATYDSSGDGRAVVRVGSAVGVLSDSSELDPPINPDGPPVTMERSRATSPIHRPVRMTSVTVQTVDDEGRHVAHRFLGLLASAVSRVSVLSIPSVGDRAREVLGLAWQGAETHAGRSMRNVLETLPRHLVFELDSHRLAQLVIDVVGLQERQIVRVFEVPEPDETASTVLVFLPKSRFTADLPDRVAAIIGEAYNSPTDEVESYVGSSSLARITMTVVDGATAHPDIDDLSALVDQLTTSWRDRIQAASARRNGGITTMMSKFVDGAPAEFQTAVEPHMAVGDLTRLSKLLSDDGSVLTALAREVDAAEHEWRIRVYQRGQSLPLSKLLPLLAHLGVEAIEEHPYEFVVDGERFFLLDIGVRVPEGVVIDDGRHGELLAALDELLGGAVEVDSFNQLVLLAGLTTAQVDILRSYAKYAHQTNFTFSQGYVESTLAQLPDLARLLVGLFEHKFDPERPDEGRAGRVAASRDEIFEALDEVPSLDQDRIVRTFLALIDATVRTSAYRDGPTLAFKFNPSMVPDLPEPKPAHEIFVCSPRVEGVHLRGGTIARGGLRWSDRPEDYRTEVLGLVKAQMVKNAVIVPVGAKGGFVVKNPKPTRGEQQDEGVACYQMFIGGLLDLTDNVVDGQVIHPDRVLRYDPDDTYLVVAADKGTASFSDIANAVAGDYHFWLDDAFASGGSAGYDHKQMGITARGAWESVRRHAHVLGLDPEIDEISAVGIGDMSGDVFGNGMLRSRTLRLIAAFDHRHIFLDPDPIPGHGYDERRRLFDLPRSSWEDYDKSLISEGGGVFDRAAKSVDLSPEIRAALDISDEQLTPNQLIRAILMAPVDLLWNGGIGTYIKASSESDASVGDRNNDTVRVDGADLRCRMVGEGGNLGVTQLGRVEYAILGGLIYTDAIDNSAGVDCSDHEVNIKILLRDVVGAGELTTKQRNVLLAEMADEVADLVLDNNRAQTLALLIARSQGLPMVNVHARYLDQLESEGHINRALEFLPTDKQIAERQSAGSGLRTPEFAVMIAYTKNVNIDEILQSDLPDSPVLERDVIDYFPTPLRERYHDEILQHRLRREIAATQLVNQMVNLSGISYDHRMTEDTGSSIADVARAWLVVREVLDFPALWDEIGQLDKLELDDQLDLYLDCRRMAERCSVWFLRSRRPPVDVSVEIERFREPVRELAAGMRSTLKGPMARAASKGSRARVKQSVPEDLAERASVWRLLHISFDVIELADRAGVSPVEASAVYWEMFDELELLWLWDGIGALPRSDRWQTQARGALRDDLLTAMADLAGSALDHGDGTVEAWMASNARSVERVSALLTQIRRADTFNITNLSVALRQLRNLAVTSVRQS